MQTNKQVIYDFIEKNFKDENISTAFKYASLLPRCSSVMFRNGDNFAEMFRVDIELSMQHKLIYIPRIYPAPSWLRLDFSYVCYKPQNSLSTNATTNGTHSNRKSHAPYSLRNRTNNSSPKSNISSDSSKTSMSRNKRLKLLDKKENEEINIIAEQCNHTICKTRHLSGYNSDMQACQRVYVNYFITHLYFECLKLTKKCDEALEFVKYVDCMRNTFSCSTPILNSIPSRLLESLYDGLLVYEKGVIQWNNNFHGIKYLPPNKSMILPLASPNPCPSQEMLVTAMDGSTVVAELERYAIRLHSSHGCHINTKNLTFDLPKKLNFSWDSLGRHLHMFSYKVNNFKNISYPKRNWTELMGEQFCRMFGFVPFQTDSIAPACKELPNFYFNAAYNTSKPKKIESLHDMWTGYFTVGSHATDKINKIIESFKNDRVFYMMGMLDYQLVHIFERCFQNFSSCILGQLAQLQPMEKVKSLEYTVNTDLRIAMHDKIQEPICPKKTIIDHEGSFIIPIFLKPSGLTYLGFNAFVNQYLAHKDLFQYTYMTKLQPFTYTADIIQEFYPNCSERPYGQEWYNYLMSGQSAVMLFECGDLLARGYSKFDVCKMWRDICVAARIDSGFVWTRNICHCPDSFEECEKNIKFVIESIFPLFTNDSCETPPPSPASSLASTSTLILE